MHKFLFATICLLLTSITIYAQSKDDIRYIERAKEVQQEIWVSDNKAFDNSEVPEKYNNESAVIIAKSVEITNAKNSKYNIMVGIVHQFRYFTTYRVRVLLNDKAALNEFSTLNYRKDINNSRSFNLYKYKNMYRTYIGAKIFKKGNKVITVNPSEEEVLTENKDKHKEGKIAIPDLQIGDILDYYVRVEEVVEADNNVRGPDVYFMGSEYPMLNYHIKYVFDKRSGVDLMNMNGAKAMTESINEKKERILEITETNLPKITGTVWASFARQVPYYMVRYGFQGSGVVATVGEIKKGPFEQFKSELTTAITNITQLTDGSLIKRSMHNYYGSKEKFKALPTDSIINYLYNWFRWTQYGYLNMTEVSNERNGSAMLSLNVPVTLSELFEQFDIEHKLILVRNRFSGRLNEVFSVGDYEVLLKVMTGTKTYWLNFNDMFHNIDELPSEYQGEEAYSITRKGSKRRVSFHYDPNIYLPVNKSNENVISENINVTFNKVNPLLLDINRISIETGSMKTNDQKGLMTGEQTQTALATMVGHRTSLTLFSSTRRTLGVADELSSAIEKEKLNQKGYFEKEIKDQYDQSPKNLTGFSILKTGLSLNEPAFEFTENFSMEDFVKKAGNNFILDIGKLTGYHEKVKEKEKIRILDVYMPCAREFVFNISVTVPEGYSCKGIEELNKKIENDVASFVSIAKVIGNVVNLSVKRIYKNNFEPASNWSKLVEVMNATSDFTDSKILIEKKRM